jgi:hypothetical protein
VLLAVDAPEAPLVQLMQLARQAGAALTLASVSTDVVDTTRRRKETSPASEIQQNLLPPRIARISGGILAGNVLPGDEIGGDGFDYVENSDGAWIGVADSMGKGTTASALGAVTPGAFRARRRFTPGLTWPRWRFTTRCSRSPCRGAFVNILLGHRHGSSSMFSSITCGHQAPLLITEQGELIELD